MQREMSSRERTLAAINHQEPDRVPIFFRSIAPFERLWRNGADRVDTLLEMGADEKTGIGINYNFHPDVTIRDWIDDKSDPNYSLACREYNTPKGPLRVVARRTPDCMYNGGIPLLSDHTVARGVEFLIKGREDLPKLAYLLQDPSKKRIEQYRESAKNVKKYADEKGIIVEGHGGSGGVCLLHLCGENMYYIDADDPGCLDEMMEMVYKADIKLMDIALDAGVVDTYYLNGCYDTAPMWSPNDYDRLFKPWLKKQADMAHQAGVKVTYFSTGDFIPHMDSLLDIGMDIINSVRPFTGGINNMRVLKEKIGHRVCLWGGINPEEVIENGTVDEVRGSVIDVLLAAAVGGGFVLSTGGSICNDIDGYDKVVAMIKTANEYGRYPIDVERLQKALKKYPHIDLS